MSIDGYTSNFYDGYASKLAERSESRRSAMLPYILEETPTGAAVLDVGAGSGRDVAAMLEHGLDAFGVEPNHSMRARAHATHPTLVGRLRNASLPGLGLPLLDVRPHGFDAVVCSAVLMHLGHDELPDALTELVRQLRPRGAEPKRPQPLLFISVPEMEPSRLQADRDSDGRKFFNHAPSGIQELLRESSMLLKRQETSEAVLQSTGTRWHMLVFQRSGSRGA